jgi:hypothetical protein
VIVILFGDSHAAQWLPTLTTLGITYGWRVLSRTKSSCTAADVHLYSDTLKREYSECDEWRRQTFDEMARISPALVVTTSIFSQTVSLADTGDAEDVWATGWARTFGVVRTHAAAAVFIVDTPYSSQDVPSCVSLHSTQLAMCAESRVSGLLEPARRAAAANAAAQLGVKIVDPTPWLCAETCPAVVGNLLVLRDQHHLTTAYATMLAPFLGRTLLSLVGTR